MDIIIWLIILFVLLILGFLIRKRVKPPICTEYLTATEKTKEKLKNDKSFILMISNIFHASYSFFYCLTDGDFSKYKGI